MAGQHERNLAGLGRDRVSLLTQSTGPPLDTPEPSEVIESSLPIPVAEEQPVPVGATRRRRSRGQRGVVPQPPAALEPEAPASDLGMAGGSPVPVAEELHQEEPTIPVAVLLPGEPQEGVDLVPEEILPEEPVSESSTETDAVSLSQPASDEPLSELPAKEPSEPVHEENPEPLTEEQEEPVPQEDPEPPAEEPEMQEETPIQQDIPTHGEPEVVPVPIEEEAPQAEPNGFVLQEPVAPEQDSELFNPVQNDEAGEILAVEQPAAEALVVDIPLTLEPVSAAAQLPRFVPLPVPPEESDPVVPHAEEPLLVPDPVLQPPVVDPIPQPPEPPPPTASEPEPREEEQLPAQEEVVLPPDPQEEEEREEDRRWSAHSCFRLISPHQNALQASEGFVGEHIRPEADGLYALHKDVRSSLQAHLRVIQKREWDTIKIPSRTGLSKTEKMQAEKWGRTKQHFADILSRSIVADVPPGHKLAPGEISETFAFKLYYWMQECLRSITGLYQERAGETAKISDVLALIGMTGLPETNANDMRKKRNQDIVMRGLWKVYQDLHMRGKNSSVEFVRQVATGIKAKHGGVMDEDELYYAMDIFRKLPFFGKEGELMNAIELATLAVSQPEGFYDAHTDISPLTPNSREWRTISFIQRKIPLTSERRVYPTSSRRRSRVINQEEDEDDEEQSSP